MNYILRYFKLGELKFEILYCGCRLNIERQGEYNLERPGELNLKRPESEFKEFEPRLKYGLFHLKLY